jgi:uncharacterized protein (TIGR00661 family)
LGNIFYGLAGEGRGHATRARAVVEALRLRHRVTLFTSDCALEMLAPLYEGTEVRVVSIPGLHFTYNRSGQVDLLGTVAGAARFRLKVEGFAKALLPELERGRPDLVIADFEPILPRACRKVGVPFISFDHQHYLVVSDLSALPFALRQQAALSAPFVRALYDWQQGTIVSSFYKPPLKPAYRDAIQVGVLLRPGVVRHRPVVGRHLLAYMRRVARPAVMQALAACGREVLVYGLGQRPPEGQLRFLPIEERRFLDDMSGCDAVISTAGNQLVGEALYLRKPLLVLPEERNFEQSVNAHFLEQSGGGWAERGTLTAVRLGAFLEAAPVLRAHIVPQTVCGNFEAVAAIERFVDQATGKRDPRQARPEAGPRLPVRDAAVSRTQWA